MTGLLWLDTDPKTTLKSKIIRAADHHRQKYGVVPTLCLVNDKQFEPLDLGILKVRPARYILPWHFLLGVEDKSS